MEAWQEAHHARRHVDDVQGFGGTLSDREVWEADLRLAALAEPLGFDSIFGVEHHFTDYAMCPDVLQFLTYMAGRTTTLKLGAAVVVLPWHDPVRVAEQILVLDHLSNGRLILGLGRGTGKIEFEGLRVEMGQARPQFKEAAEAILAALESGVMEYHGQYVDQPRVELRPSPLATFEGRTYSATVSPESAEIMARLGTGVLIVPQKPWRRVKEEREVYRATYREAIGQEPPAPIVSGFIFVDDNADRAEEHARRWMGRYWDSVIAHYDLDQPHLKSTPGYEFHGQMYDRLQQPGGLESMTEFYIGLHPFGTPEQVYDKAKGFCDLFGADSFVGNFRYGGMPPDVAERSVRLFAAEVLPELKAVAPAAERLARV